MIHFITYCEVTCHSQISQCTWIYISQCTCIYISQCTWLYISHFHQQSQIVLAKKIWFFSILLVLENLCVCGSKVLLSNTTCSVLQCVSSICSDRNDCEWMIVRFRKANMCIRSDSEYVCIVVRNETTPTAAHCKSSHFWLRFTLEYEWHVKIIQYDSQMNMIPTWICVIFFYIRHLIKNISSWIYILMMK